MNFKDTKDKYTFDDLVEIVSLLRAPGGCPWDREQTHQSIKKNLIEEGYELIEAIDGGNPEKIADESGDLLLQVVFHAIIGKDSGEYEINDVTDAICRKLIHRHPHVFGEVEVADSGEVLKNWDAIKRADREQSSIAEELRGVSKYLPALMRAEKIQKKAAKTGFCWESAGQALDKLAEEAQELREAVRDNTNIDEELGDMLFAAVRVASTLDKDPEQALHSACEKFIRRFTAMEQSILAEGRTLEEVSREELLASWDAQKRNGR